MAGKTDHAEMVPALIPGLKKRTIYSPGKRYERETEMMVERWCRVRRCRFQFDGRPHGQQ